MSLKLTKSQAHFVFILLMCLSMSCFMSLVMTFINLGFSSELIRVWLKNWAISFVVAVPVASTVVPPLRRFVASITRE